MKEALDLTHQILHDMGAKVAPAKSFIFTNKACARKWYQQHAWKNLG